MNTSTPSTIHSVLPAAMVVLLGIMMSVLDGTIMNVALPTLADSFHTSEADATWIVNAYQLVITMTLLSFASLGEHYGYKRMFMIAVAAFTLASAGCALSQTFHMLVAMRVVQGLAASAMMGANTALLRFVYPPQILGRGLGLNAMVVAVSTAAGPSIAGAILSVTTWHWLFLINLPIGVVALLMGRRYLKIKQPEVPGRFDTVSSVESALVMGLLIFAVECFSRKADYRFILLQMVAMVVIGWLLVRRERKRNNPLLPVDLLRIPIFSLSICTSITSFAAQMLAMVSLPFLLQNGMGYDAVKVGLLITPWPLATILTGPLSGRLVEKIPAGLLGGIGMAIFATGLFLLYSLPAHPDEMDIIWRMAICGLGFGCFQTPNNVTIISSAPVERSGGASGMLGSARLIGQTLGTALVALLFQVFTTGGGKACLLTAAIFAIAAGVVSSLRLATPRPSQTS